MESLSYLHLSAASQEIPTQTEEAVGSSWDAQVWDEIFEELEEEEDEKRYGSIFSRIKSRASADSLSGSSADPFQPTEN